MTPVAQRVNSGLPLRFHPMLTRVATGQRLRPPVLAGTTTRFGVRHVSGRELELLLDPPSSFRPAGEFKSYGMRSAEIVNIDKGCYAVTDCERVLIQRPLE